MNLKKVVDVIRNRKLFVLGTHKDVEGDALGSTLGMYMLLKRLNKKVYVYHPQKVPFNYKFLPYSEEICNIPPRKFSEAGIIMDCSDISRLGEAKNSFIHTDVLINIDHHISNTDFADINYVDSKASSASELVYKIYKKFFPKVSKNTAIALYTGIFTDTGSFSYSPTTSYVHRIVSELIERGVSPPKVYHSVYSAFKTADIAFIGKILSDVREDKTGKIIWVTTKKWRESSFGDLTEAVFHNLRSVYKGEVFVLFKYIKKDTIRVNFRANGKVNVNRVAKFFGGGGHKNAAGTTVRDKNISSVEKKIVSFIKRYI